jgi:hypothetical protein
MRFRLGIVAGFALGYYIGARAGRERYEDINRMLRKLQRSDAFDTAADKARAVVDLTVERAKDVVDDKLHHDKARDGGAKGDTPKTWPSTMDPIVRP